MKKLFKLTTIIIMILLALFAVGCGDSDTDSVNTRYEGSIDYVAGEHSEKINYYFSEIHLKAFDVKDYEKTILTKINEKGGYVTINEHKYSGTRAHYSYLYIKVPTEHFFQVKEYIEENYKVFYNETTSEDLTSRVMYAKASYDNLKLTLQRYENLLEQENLTVAEKTSIIKEIGKVSEQIAQAERNWASTYQDYEYSTIIIEIGNETTFIKKVGIILAIFSPFGLVLIFVLFINLIDAKRYGNKYCNSEKKSIKCFFRSRKKQKCVQENSENVQSSIETFDQKDNK